MVVSSGIAIRNRLTQERSNLGAQSLMMEFHGIGCRLPARRVGLRGSTPPRIGPTEMRKLHMASAIRTEEPRGMSAVPALSSGGTRKDRNQG